jgi:DNA-binding XRE family transcriptional regulator
MMAKDEVAKIQVRDGITGNALAARLEVNPSTITRLMKDGMQPSLRLVQMVNREFPELRPFCAQLLRISDRTVADEEYTPEQVPA